VVEKMKKYGRRANSGFEVTVCQLVNKTSTINVVYPDFIDFS
jgi:hypothetical protein